MIYHLIIFVLNLNVVKVIIGNELGLSNNNLRIDVPIDYSNELEGTVSFTQHISDELFKSFRTLTASRNDYYEMGEDFERTEIIYKNETDDTNLYNLKLDSITQYINSWENFTDEYPYNKYYYNMTIEVVPIMEPMYSTNILNIEVELLDSNNNVVTTLQNESSTTTWYGVSSKIYLNDINRDISNPPNYGKVVDWRIKMLEWQQN